MFSLKEFGKEYDALAKKYKLPSFTQINDHFEIDKIDRETFNVLRLVRKVMMEKVVNSISFLELLSNPSNTPRIYYAYMRSMTGEDKRIIDKLYDSLSKLSVESLELEIDGTEKREAEIIKKIYDVWTSAKPGFRIILKHMRSPNGIGDNGQKKEKSYFG